MDVVLKLKPSPRRQLLQRLAMMGEHKQVQKAVERILSRNGLFPTLKELDEPFLGEVFGFSVTQSPKLQSICWMN